MSRFYGIYLKNEQMELTELITSGTNSCKLKGD